MKAEDFKIKEGKTCYLYDDRATDDVCKAHVLHILPHPEREGDQLIVYRWYGKHRQRWWYGVTDMRQQELWADYVQKVINHNKEQKKYRKCGQCGYYMAYCQSDGSKDHYGDCASIGMNKECNEGGNPFNDPDETILQVDSNDDACGFFKANQTHRVKEYIKAHPDLYYRDTHFKPKPVR